MKNLKICERNEKKIPKWKMIQLLLWMINDDDWEIKWLSECGLFLENLEFGRIIEVNWRFFHSFSNVFEEIMKVQH